ncbi:MAG: 4Fe-4S binding protein [candidate division KSB1 bacterium]|nr:4Fe-4S binding protein [candidate division KSB1 bacterium]
MRRKGLLIGFFAVSSPLFAGADAFKFFSFWNSPKVFFFLLAALAGTILISTFRLSRRTRILLQIATFFVLGVLYVLPLGEWTAGFGLHPSPMCIIEKPFMFLKRSAAVPLIFISLFTLIALLSVITNKGFCSWACPLGALQELLYRLPIVKKQKRTLPFVITQTIRIALLVLFIVFLFTLGFSLYEYINAFHLLHWQWNWVLFVPLLLVLSSLFFYRPFCYAVCPMGLATWIFEQFSFFRVRLDKQACTDCGQCLKKSPCPTVPAILAQKKLRPDCHACGDCINACAEKALKFKI